MFPTIQSLAEAPTVNVLSVWQGLGYNRRALFLHRAAKIIMSEYGGSVPNSVEALDALPGIGYATACAIQAFAFNGPVVFIETNIRRVFIHFFFSEKEGIHPTHKKLMCGIHDREILPLVSDALDKKNPREWYWALMDYGAMLALSLPKSLNPNRSSAHYAKQSKFKGSDRQIRGQILKMLVTSDKKNVTWKIQQISKSFNNDKVRIEKVLSTLERDGFLEIKGGVVTLKKEPVS